MAILAPFVPDRIWISEYPIRYFGSAFNARMTVVRLRDGGLWIHSPGPIDADLHQQITALGPVAHLVAPGWLHHLYVAPARERFPDAEIHLCPGLERKRPDLRYDHLLGDEAPEAWRGELEQVVVRGALLIQEVAFFHQPSRTLILTDLVENFTDQTPDVNWVLKFWFKWLFFMWERPRPAPEYRLSWTRRRLARECLEKVLAWDFERVVLSHGDLIERDAKTVVRGAWRL